MQIRTFTSFWNVEKKVYSIYDLQLPVAISIRSLGIFVGAAIPYWIILSIFGVPFNLSTIIIWLAFPTLIAVLGNRPIFEGKTLIDYLTSRVKFLFESKKYKGLTPATEKEEKIIISEFFYTK